MIFVDTGVWVAAAVNSDANHAAAVRLLANPPEALTTTDYVADEALTLLRARGHRAAALATGRRLFGGRIVQLHHVDPGDIAAAWHLFQQFGDKDWSFTDCTSYVVMQRLGIATAFSFDHHFRQFGTVSVVP